MQRASFAAHKRRPGASKRKTALKPKPRQRTQSSTSGLPSGFLLLLLRQTESTFQGTRHQMFSTLRDHVCELSSPDSSRGTLLEALLSSPSSRLARLLSRFLVVFWNSSQFPGIIGEPNHRSIDGPIDGKGIKENHFLHSVYRPVS